ncbi:MAG: YraN family protein [Cellulosilyticaceae bacterium]
MGKSGVKQNNRVIGSYYEDRAATFLESKGYRLLARNFRNAKGEIDIIATDGEYTVFVEIKYRKHVGCGYPRESVHRRKQATLIQVATFYLVKYKLYDTPVRFDVIEIVDQELHHIENAFMKGE